MAESHDGTTGRAAMLSRLGRYGAQTVDGAAQAEEEQRKEQLGEVAQASTGLIAARESILADVALQRETGAEDPKLVSTLDAAEPVLNQAIWSAKMAAAANVQEEASEDLRTRLKARHDSVFTESLARTVEHRERELGYDPADEPAEVDDLDDEYEDPEAVAADNDGFYTDEEGTLWKLEGDEWSQVAEQATDDDPKEYDPLQEWSDAVDERRGDNTDADEAWAGVVG